MADDFKPIATNRKARHDYDIVETVEAGHMTKDLAILVGPEQPWMTTEQFFEAVRTNLEAAMAKSAEPQETAPARA